MSVASPASGSMVITVADLSEADRVGDLLADAFAADPVLSWLFRGPTRAAARRAFFGFLAREAGIPLGATHLVAGACATWTPLNAPAWPDERTASLRDLVARCAGAEAAARHEILGRLLTAARPIERHCYLGALGTLPDRQGRGLGQALLAHGLGLVDEIRAPAYLEATHPRGVPFYQRHGFAPVARIALPDGPELTTMYRPARSAP